MFRRLKAVCMNRRKWENQQHGRAELFAKLAEEFGEVARLMADSYEGKEVSSRLVEELDHVEFIASVFKNTEQNILARFEGLEPSEAVG